MNYIFLILGYGVPKNIIKDQSYNLYLEEVFNNIYKIVTKNKIKNPLIIACGGPTDLLKPYKKTEAEEIIKLFKIIIKKEVSIKSITKDWIFTLEKKSLSTLENLLNSKEIISENKINKAKIIIFCEYTRKKRIKILAENIFSKNYNLKIIPIDFDTSANRYLSSKYLAEKEKVELNHSFWALKSSNNLKEHHKIFEEKFEYLRKAKHKKIRIH